MGETSKISASLPPELETFRWDHGETATEICLVCHPFGARPPTVDTYIGQNPNCLSCHAPGSGTPVVTLDSLTKQSSQVTHETPYPGYNLFDTWDFIGGVESLTSVRSGGRGEGVEFIQSLSTGAQWELGNNNSLSAQVSASGQAYVMDETVLGYDYDESDFYNSGLRLQGASVGYETENDSLSVEMDAGLLAPVTLHGRNSILGTSVYLNVDPLSAYGFFGSSIYTDPDEWLYGAGLQALRSDGANGVVGGIDLSGRTGGTGNIEDDSLDLALNGGAFFSVPDIGLNGMCVDKTYLQPTDPYTLLDRTENSCRVSVGDTVDFSADYFYQPAQSDDVFSGLAIEDNSTFGAQVDIQPVPFVRFHYRFGTGTYLLYDHQVVINLEIADHFSFRPMVEDRTARLFGKELHSTRVGGEVSVDFRNFHTRLGLLHREGDSIPIFPEMDNAVTRVTLSGDYKVRDVTLSGFLMADVTEGFRPLSGQLRITIPFGEKIRSRDEQLSLAQESFALLTREDPILGSLVNPAIYPKQTIPLNTTMHHKKMTEAGLTCPSCHGTARSNGQMILPPREICDSCHHQNEWFEGHEVDIVYDRDGIVIPRSYIKYDHRSSGHVPEGDVDNSVCINCHRTIPQVTVGTINDLPPMSICMECHEEKGINKEKVEEYRLQSECQLCHYSKPDGTLITDTPNGPLYPRDKEGYFPAIAHGLPETSARDYWYEVHGVMSKSYDKVCRQCHSAPFEAACNDCHGTPATGVMRPDSHDADWQLEHYIDWLSGDRSCGKCHTQTPGDEMALCRDCHDSRGLTYNYRHVDGWRYNCTDESPTNGHQDAAWWPEAEATGRYGGAQLCMACHTPIQQETETRRSIGCLSCHGADHLGTCNQQ